MPHLIFLLGNLLRELLDALSVRLIGERDVIDGAELRNKRRVLMSERRRVIGLIRLMVRSYWLTSAYFSCIAGAM